MLMTIAKAIEILSDSANRGMTSFGPDFKDAEKLGIEALKHVRDFRLTVDGEPVYLLPGETKD